MVAQQSNLPGTPEDSFHRIFDQHYRSVLRYAIRRVGVDDADDVVEDVFTAAWRHIDSAPAEPETLWWLLGIARRTVANHLRSRRRRFALITRLGPVPPTVDPEAPDPALATALGRLPTRDQEILRLIAWEGLEPREIGMVVGCTPATAAVRAHRARRRLQEELERGGWER